VIGNPIATWMTPDTQAIFEPLLNPSNGSVEPRRQQLELVASDASRVPVLLSVSPLQITDMPDAFGLVATDLTEQRKSEAVVASERQAREQLDAANQSRRVLLSVIEDQKRAEESIRLQAHMLNTIGQAVIATDRDGLITYANRFVENLYGWTPAEMRGRNILEVTVPTLGSAQAAAILERLQRGENWSGEFPVQHRDGRQFPALVTNTPLQNAQGQLTGIIGISTDITAQKQAETRIKRLNRVHAVLSGINALIVRVRGREELFRESCRIAVEDGGFRMSLIAIVNPDTATTELLASRGVDEALLADIKAILASPERVSTTMVDRAIRWKKAVLANNTKNDPQIVFGQKYVEIGVNSMAVLPLIVADAAIGVLVLYSDEVGFFDEEELKLLLELAGDIGFAVNHIGNQERLDFLAYYDVVTGLANRRLFLDRVAQQLRNAHSGGYKLAMFVLDLERFRNINDSLGRPAGDALLKQVALWLTEEVKDPTRLAHLGADHFAIMLPQVRPEGNVAHLVEKSMAAFLDHLFVLNDAVFRIPYKVGVALFPDDGADADTLFRNAEVALKRAKATGERYLFYTPSMTASVAGQLTLENQLRQALDRGEFVLHYQPKVNLADGMMTSAEALIRWNDPRTGLVPPGRFIPILEETGLIHEVGRWALRQALADYLRWRAAGLPAVRIAVNVSPLQLRHRDFIAEVKAAIGIDPQAAAGLEIEITESVIMADVQGSIATLKAIRALGICIAIDDFGTGFSSLSYLSKLPVDTLKIDRSFVIDMTAAPQGLALVSTIINLAHALKLKVVAEGVETEEQSRLLLVLGCDEMQGFLFSKAVPGEEFATRFLAAPIK
jgi:diguanylate cyclase (GGDEF)-like protein/PAS domain S-box-containing protein